jgi:integrase
MSESLTEKFVKTVHPPEKGAVTHWDDDPKAKGFGLRVYASGAISFFVNYRIDGREKRITIGSHPTWTVEAARKRAKELRREIDKGQDPAGAKRERREAPTVQDLIDRYIDEHLPTKAAGRLADQRIADETKMLGEIAHHLGKHTKVTDVHGGDVRDMHRKISESIGRLGPRRVRANRILAVCSKLFSFSLVPLAGENKPWRDAAMGNPCRGVPRNHEEGRERFYSQAELAAITDALAEYPGVGADCLRLVMLTGCRPGEAMLARWSQFDAEPGFWVKPSAHVKQRKVHKLPLSPPALELIDGLRSKRNGKGEWLFPGDIEGEPLKAIHHAWEFVRERAQLQPFEGKAARPYDLRHTVASVGAGGGLSLPIIGKLLGHTQARTTQRYAHLADDPLKEAADKIGKVIGGAGKGGADVLPMRGRS